MDAHELAEKIRKNTKSSEASCQEIVKWCGENVKDLDLTNNDQFYLYEIATRYLMNYKIGKWDKDDANVVIKYLAKKYAREVLIDENIDVKILEESDYKETYGSSSAICVNNGDDTFNIAYSPKVVENLVSNDANQFLRGMQIIFHEVVHAWQNSVIQRTNIQGVDIPKTSTIYIMTLETISRKCDPKFYDKNYSRLIKENHAEKIGLRKAMETMEMYNSKLYQLYNQDVIKQMLEDYDRNFYDAKVSLESGIDIDFMLQIDALSSMYIEKHPEIIEKFSILQVGYNLDGTKKTLSQLIPERDDMLINSDEAPDEINELYETIANHRNVANGGLKGTKDELFALNDYITRTGTDDEFIFGLIKYRLEKKTEMTPEQISDFMEREHAIAAKTRQERQEIKNEKSESIKDEVGDELKPKTESRQQEEEQKTKTMWQNRFQSWDRNSVNLPNSAKRKEEAVKVVQDIERKKTQQEKHQEQEK